MNVSVQHDGRPLSGGSPSVLGGPAPLADRSIGPALPAGLQPRADAFSALALRVFVPAAAPRARLPDILHPAQQPAVPSFDLSPPSARELVDWANDSVEMEAILAWLWADGWTVRLSPEAAHGLMAGLSDGGYDRLIRPLGEKLALFDHVSPVSRMMYAAAAASEAFVAPLAGQALPDPTTCWTVCEAVVEPSALTKATPWPFGGLRLLSQNMDKKSFKRNVGHQTLVLQLLSPERHDVAEQALVYGFRRDDAARRRAFRLTGDPHAVERTYDELTCDDMARRSAFFGQTSLGAFWVGVHYQANDAGQLAPLSVGAREAWFRPAGTQLGAARSDIKLQVTASLWAGDALGKLPDL